MKDYFYSAELIPINGGILCVHGILHIENSISPECAFNTVVKELGIKYEVDGGKITLKAFNNVT